MNSESLDSALLALQAIVQNESGLSVQELDAALARVAAFGSPRTAAPLLKLLDDQAQQDERMFSLIHAAEAFDDDAYVPELLTVLPSLRERSPKWATSCEAVRCDAARATPVKQATTNRRVSPLCSKPTPTRISWKSEKFDAATDAVRTTIKYRHL